MKIISLKIEDRFLKNLEAFLRKHHYSTKTEFIREAIRDKMKEIQKEEMLKAVARIHGSSKHKTTDEDLHRAREKMVKMYEEKFK